MNWVRLRGKIRRSSFIGALDIYHRLDNGSWMSREAHVQFCERLWAKFPWPTQPYIRILISFVYLAVIIDIYSRKVVGYAIGRTLTPELTLSTLKMALANRKIGNLIHHSDQGVQYASTDYTNLLKEHSIRISMSAKGNPYDNAYVESFFKTLKQEEVYLWQYETYHEVIERVPYFILDVYNRKRLHSSLSYRPPEEFENLLTENTSQKEKKAKTIFV